MFDLVQLVQGDHIVWFCGSPTAPNAAPGRYDKGVRRVDFGTEASVDSSGKTVI